MARFLDIFKQFFYFFQQFIQFFFILSAMLLDLFLDSSNRIIYGKCRVDSIPNNDIASSCLDTSYSNTILHSFFFF